MSIILVAAAQSACTGVQTFSNTARAGDTISVAFGYGDYESNHANRENTEVTIQDSVGTITHYKVGDPRLKAIIDLYPDPASYLMVGVETNQDIRSNETVIGSYLETQNSNSRDWHQTVAFLDLPDSMSLGVASITFTTSDGKATSNVNVIAGTGSSHLFDTNPSTTYINSLDRLQSLERSPHHLVSLVGGSKSLVYALDVAFLHDPDVDNGGVGKVYVTNPRGDLTSINWRDTGTILHVLVTPTKEQSISRPETPLFYVVGGIRGLKLSSISAVNSSGDPLSDVSVGVSPIIYTFPSTPVSAGSEVVVTGDELCNDCVNPDTDAWISVNGAWTQLTLINTTNSSFSFDMPVTTAVGDDVIYWVQVPGGIASKNVILQ